MNISLNWLKDYLKINRNTEEICKILTSIGLEVGGYEEFEAIKGGLKGLVVGHVLTCEAHPGFGPSSRDHGRSRTWRTGTNRMRGPKRGGRPESGRCNRRYNPVQG